MESTSKAVAAESVLAAQAKSSAKASAVTPTADQSDLDEYRFLDEPTTPPLAKSGGNGATNAKNNSLFEELDLGEYDLSDLGPPPAVKSAPQSPNAKVQAASSPKTSASGDRSIKAVRNDSIDAIDDEFFNSGFSDSINDAIDSAKPASEEFRFKCKVCETAMFARPEQIGNMVRCPDCYSEFSIPRPAPKVAKKPKQKLAPADAMNFREHEAAPVSGKKRPSEADDFLRKAEAELEQEKDKGADITYDFDAQGLLDRAFGFMKDSNVYIVAAAPGFLLGLVLVAGQFVWEMGGQNNPQLARIGIIALLVVFGLPLVAASLANGLAILEATANAQKKVDTWPGFNLAESLGEIFMLLIAAILAAIPGGLIGWGLTSIDMDPLLAIGATLLSIWLLFPIIVLGMLDNQAITNPYSPEVLSSMGKKPDSWAGMYTLNGFAMATFFLLYYMCISNSMLYKMIAAMALPFVIFFIFRQIGNLAYYISDVTSLAFETDDDDDS